MDPKPGCSHATETSVANAFDVGMTIPLDVLRIGLGKSGDPVGLADRKGMLKMLAC